jgi:hypothetical protein
LCCIFDNGSPELFNYRDEGNVFDVSIVNDYNEFVKSFEQEMCSLSKFQSNRLHFLAIKGGERAANLKGMNQHLPYEQMIVKSFTSI